jgi:hypothetical protein
MIKTRPHSVEVSIINKRLVDVFGKELNGRPRFRVAFSDDEKEKRVGTFDEFHGKIFLRQFFGVREVPKYSYIKMRWVLEKSAWNPEKEIMNHNGFEPVYVFQDKDKNYLMPIYKVCEVIIHGLFRKTPKTVMEDQTEKEDARRMQLDMDRLEDKCTDFSMLKQLRELVTVPSTYKQSMQTEVNPFAKGDIDGRQTTPIQVRDHRRFSGALSDQGEKNRSNAE